MKRNNKQIERTRSFFTDMGLLICALFLGVCWNFTGSYLFSKFFLKETIYYENVAIMIIGITIASTFIVLRDVIDIARKLINFDKKNDR